MYKWMARVGEEGARAELLVEWRVAQAAGSWVPKTGCARAGDCYLLPLPQQTTRSEAATLLTRAGEIFRRVLEVDGWSSRCVVDGRVAICQFVCAEWKKYRFVCCLSAPCPAGPW